YEKRVKEGRIGQELYKSRNFHQAFDHGRNAGLVIAGIASVTGGRLPGRLKIKSGPEHLVKLKGDKGDRYGDLKYDDKLTFAKLTDVYYAGTHHNEDQPSHLK